MKVLNIIKKLNTTTSLAATAPSSFSCPLLRLALTAESTKYCGHMFLRQFVHHLKWMQEQFSQFNDPNSKGIANLNLTERQLMVQDQLVKINKLLDDYLDINKQNIIGFDMFSQEMVALDKQFREACINLESEPTLMAMFKQVYCDVLNKMELVCHKHRNSKRAIMLNIKKKIC